MTFGDKLKGLAKKYALTSTEMSEIFGCTPSQIRNWYNAKRMPNNMSNDDLYVIREVFGEDEKYFLSSDVEAKVTVAKYTFRYILNKREEDYCDTRRLK